MAILHSFWQAALLLLLFIILDKVLLRNNSPLAKRNFLFAALVAQLLLFFFTFFIFFSGSQSDSSVADLTKTVTGLLGAENIQAVTPWIFSMYIFIISYKLIKAIYTWTHFSKQYKSGLQKPAIDLRLFTESKAHQFGIKRKVKLWLSNSVNTPVTFGFFKPVILLPVALLGNISIQQAETLILHELTHIRTNDYLLNWFLLFADTIFFYNPFVSNLCTRIRMEREKNCDIRVLAFEYSPALYAETLLQAERMKQMIPNFQLAAVNRKKQLLHRIQFFSGNKFFTEPTMRFNRIAPLVGLLLLLLLSSVILFNTGNPASSMNSAGTIPYLPFSNYLISDADLEKNNLQDYPAQKEFTEKIETQPVVTVSPKQIKKDEPVNKALPQIAGSVTKRPEQNFYMPVSIRENDAAKQIIIKEESSDSKTASVKIYYLSYENGEWVLKPELVVTAKEIMLDSLPQTFDSSSRKLKRVYPPQQ